MKIKVCFEFVYDTDDEQELALKALYGVVHDAGAALERIAIHEELPLEALQDYFTVEILKDADEADAEDLDLAEEVMSPEEVLDCIYEQNSWVDEMDERTGYADYLDEVRDERRD